MAKRIALVEDEKAIRENYASSLRKQGYEVFCYETKDEAMEAFAVRLPDLAILDVGKGRCHPHGPGGDSRSHPGVYRGRPRGNS